MIFSRITKWAVFVSMVSVALLSTEAMALFEGELGYGLRTGDVFYDVGDEKDKTKSYTGGEFYLNAMVDPIPLVPVSFGLVYQGYAFDASKPYKEILQEQVNEPIDYTGTYKGTGMLYGPALKVWAPVPFVKPYLRYAYLMGKEMVNLDVKYASVDGLTTMTMKGKSESSLTGSELTIGFSFTPLKLVAFRLEYGMFSGASKLSSSSIDMSLTSPTETISDTVTEASMTDDEKKNDKIKHKSIRFGVSVGI